MKKARKGFTLVELLIVVAILGILSVSMMMAVGGTTAKAKASMIASNFDAARTAVAAYYAGHIMDTNLASTDANTMIKDGLGNWEKLKSGKAITYGASGTIKEGNVVVSADFTNDPSSKDIAKLLEDNYNISADASSGTANMNITPK